MTYNFKWREYFTKFGVVAEGGARQAEDPDKGGNNADATEHGRALFLAHLPFYYFLVLTPLLCLQHTLTTIAFKSGYM
jgi:hypothetical protein